MRALLLCLVVLGCARAAPLPIAPPASSVGPPALNALIEETANRHGVPVALVHRVVDRESDYRPDARNGPYWGLMQILPETARTMGHRGPPEELLDPAINLEYGVRYLRGAWLVSDGDQAAAVNWYARGYYFEARDRCMLVETGLLDREIGC